MACNVASRYSYVIFIDSSYSYWVFVSAPKCRDLVLRSYVRDVGGVVRSPKLNISAHAYCSLHLDDLKYSGTSILRASELRTPP